MAKRKHQESISSPRKQLHWQNLSDVTILKLEATEGLQFPEEYLDGKLWLIWSVSATHPSSLIMEYTAVRVFWNNLHIVYEIKVGKRTLSSKYQGFGLFLFGGGADLCS